jgi:hypothetical protein
VKLSELFRPGGNPEDLPVSIRHAAWLDRNLDATYSPQAISFARSVLAKEVGGKRTRASGFRASGTGGCLRRQVFRRLGIEENRKGDVGKLANIFQTGNFYHLKWQMAGLTEGWLVQAEVPLDDRESGISGTADGVIWDGSLFEFKSINGWGYKKVAQGGPDPLHVLQVHAYMIAGGFDKASIVYESKETGEWREERVHKDPAVVRKIKEDIEKMHTAWEFKRLPEILPGCLEKTGRQWSDCPFSHMCLTRTGWEE